MNYDALFGPYCGQVVRAGVIGVGEFGTTLVAQAQSIAELAVAAVCDRDPARAAAALTKAGYLAADVVVCQSLAEARSAMNRGAIAVVTDGTMLADLPLDIVVEATGDGAAAAANAAAAIAKAKHVAMVTKEADSVIGPLLHARARGAGCVYTTVDGDQPSLMVGLISWARFLGLEISAAGKSSEYDLVFDRRQGRLSWLDRSFPAAGLERVWSPGPEELRDAVARRAEILGAIPRQVVSDLCEIAVVANATGLMPDSASLHAPILRTPEVPSVLRPAPCGGILSSSAGALDIFNCLRAPDEVSFAGGVFAVIACRDLPSWRLLGAKGIPVAHDGGHALLYNPQHLLGVEAPISLLSAVLLRQPTGATVSKPTVDLVARAAIDLKAGQMLSVTNRHKHEVGTLTPQLLPAGPAAAGRPIPYYMAVGCRLARDVAAGELLTLDAVEEPEASVLWSLRREQDALFFGGRDQGGAAHV